MPVKSSKPVKPRKGGGRRKTVAPKPAPKPVLVKRASLSSKLHLPQSPMAVAFRAIKPTWRHYVDYVEMAAQCGDKEMRRYLQAYQALSSREKSTHSPEQVCDLSGVATKDLFAAVCGQLWMVSNAEATMITAIAHPRVVERTAQVAQTRKGTFDRELFHKSTGFLPTPKAGPSIVLHNNPQTLSVSSGPLRPALPSPEEEVLSMERAEEQKAIAG